MWAFIYSIIFTNVVDIPQILAPGINFCSRTFLRGLIASLGIVTNALLWLTVGPGIINAFIIIFVVFFVSLFVGKKFGISNSLSTLIGVGTSICGASAIAATAPAIGAKEEEVGLALGCITLFGLLAMFLYPFLFVNTIVGEWLSHNLNVYAIWVGTGIHETAGVTAAGGALGMDCEALSIKSIRIFMIGPMVLLATYLNKKIGNNVSIDKKSRIALPIYGIVFIIFSIFSSFLDLYAPQILELGFDWLSVKTVLKGTIFKFLFALCFAGVGSKVRIRSMADIGLKSFAVGASMAIFAGILALLLAIIVSPLIPM